MLIYAKYKFASVLIAILCPSANWTELESKGPFVKSFTISEKYASNAKDYNTLYISIHDPHLISFISQL